MRKTISGMEITIEGDPVTVLAINISCKPGLQQNWYILQTFFLPDQCDLTLFRSHLHPHPNLSYCYCQHKLLWNIYFNETKHEILWIIIIYFFTKSGTGVTFRRTWQHRCHCSEMLVWTPNTEIFLQKKHFVSIIMELFIYFFLNIWLTVQVIVSFNIEVELWFFFSFTKWKKKCHQYLPSHHSKPLRLMFIFKTQIRYFDIHWHPFNYHFVVTKSW